MTELGEILRTETAGLHERSGTRPFFRALRAGSLRRASVLSFLRSLSIIHAVLEGSVASVSSGPVAELRRHAPAKMRLLSADLEALDAESTPSVTAAIRGAIDYANELLTLSGNPPALIGVIYVLETLQNRGVVLRRAYSRCLSVPEGRLSYVGCYGAATASVCSWLSDSSDWIANVKDLTVKLDEAAKPSC